MNDISINLGVAISVIASIIGILTFYYGRKQANVKNTEDQTILKTNVQNIEDDVTVVKQDVKEIKQKIEIHSEKLIDQKVRIEQLEKRG